MKSSILRNFDEFKKEDSEKFRLNRIKELTDKLIETLNSLEINEPKYIAFNVINQISNEVK